MKVIIIYGSTLGKTARLAELASQILKNKGVDVIVKDVVTAKVDDLYDGDAVILGCSTWDNGMLQYDFRGFFRQLSHTPLSNRKFAVFGLGSHHYPHFCTSVDILCGAINAMQGTLIGSIKFDIDHDEPEDKCDSQMIDWIEKIYSKLTSASGHQ